MNNKKIRIDYEGITSDIKKYGRNVAKNIVTTVRDELTEEARYSIQQFYNSYSPIYYNRHYYNFLNQSFRKYYQNSHNKIYRGGVELSYSFLDDIYEGTTQQVFTSVYEGIHGLPIENNNIPQMSPSPMQMIENKQQKILNDIDKYINNAKQLAKKDKYSILQFK